MLSLSKHSAVIEGYTTKRMNTVDNVLHPALTAMSVGLTRLSGMHNQHLMLTCEHLLALQCKAYIYTTKWSQQGTSYRTISEYMLAVDKQVLVNGQVMGVDRHDQKFSKS